MEYDWEYAPEEYDNNKTYVSSPTKGIAPGNSDPEAKHMKALLYVYAATPPTDLQDTLY